MDVSQIATSAVAVISVVIALAALPDHGWIRLKRWLDALSVWIVWIWIFSGLAFGVYGVWTFSQKEGLPTRGEILWLITSLMISLAYAFVAVHTLLEPRIQERKRRVRESEKEILGALKQVKELVNVNRDLRTSSTLHHQLPPPASDINGVGPQAVGVSSGLN